MLFKPSHVWIFQKTFRCGQQTKATPGQPCSSGGVWFPRRCEPLAVQLREATRSPMLVPVRPFDRLDQAVVAGPAENEASFPFPLALIISWCYNKIISWRLTASHWVLGRHEREERSTLVVEGLERGSDEWDRAQLSAGSGTVWQRLCVADCPSLSWAYKQPMDCKSFWMSDQKLAFSSLSFRRSACLGTGGCGAGRVIGQKHENAQETSGVGRAFYFYLVNSELFSKAFTFNKKNQILEVKSSRK